MDWSNLIQTIVTGLADGGIYAVLALALVLIHRATGVINFAQGEMAMFSTYIAWWARWNPPTPKWTMPAVTCERS